MKNSLSTYFRLFPILVLWLGLINLVVGCSDSDDEPLLNDPTVDMKFFNMDSLQKVNLVLDQVGQELIYYDSVVGSLTDSVTKITSEIIALNEQIELGQNDLIPQRDALRVDSAFYHDQLVVAEQQDSTYAAQQSVWNTVVTDINAGRVLITEVENQANGKTFSFTDSATVFAIPLDMNNDQSALFLTIGGIKYAVGLRYSRIEGVDEKGRVTISTFGLRIDEQLGHEFDSVKVNCENEDCLDEETTFWFYF